MPQISQTSYPSRPVRRAEARSVEAPVTPLAWPVSALILLSVSAAFWFGVVEAAIHVF